MKSVYLLWHSYDSSDTGKEEDKLIGVYGSEELAQEAIERLKIQPGFKDLPEYFIISQCELNKDHWTEGFVTETYALIWSVWRQDETAQSFLVKAGLVESDALRMVRELEKKDPSHTYLAKPNR